MRYIKEIEESVRLLILSLEKFYLIQKGSLHENI